MCGVESERSLERITQGFEVGSREGSIYLYIDIQYASMHDGSCSAATISILDVELISISQCA